VNSLLLTHAVPKKNEATATERSATMKEGHGQPFCHDYIVEFFSNNGEHPASKVEGAQPRRLPILSHEPEKNASSSPKLRLKPPLVKFPGITMPVTCK
jgi:hypothetical protein